MNYQVKSRLPALIFIFILFMPFSDNIGISNGSSTEIYSELIWSNTIYLSSIPTGITIRYDDYNLGFNAGIIYQYQFSNYYNSDVSVEYMFDGDPLGELRSSNGTTIKVDEPMDQSIETYYRGVVQPGQTIIDNIYVERGCDLNGMVKKNHCIRINIKGLKVIGNGSATIFISATIIDPGEKFTEDRLSINFIIYLPIVVIFIIITKRKNRSSSSKDKFIV